MEQLLPFVNIADCMLHCTQINLTQINLFDLWTFWWKSFSAFATIARGAHEKWEMSIMFFAPKNYALIHIPASETSRPLATYVARRSLLELRSREISKSRIKKRSTCGKSICERVMYYFPSDEQLMHMFLSFFNNMETIYQKQMEAIPFSILSCDHTFKVSKQIGVVRRLDKAFVDQF